MIKRERFEIPILGLLHGVSHIYTSSLAPLYILIQGDFGISFTELGLIGSVYTTTSALQFLAGYLVDRLGWKKLTFLGMLLNAAMVFLYGSSPSFPALLLLIFLAGICSTTFHPATYSLIALKSPREHLTKSMAYHQFGGFFGGAVGTALVAVLSAYFGWRGSLRFIALLGLPFVFLFLFGVKEEARGAKTDRAERSPGPENTGTASLLGKAFAIILLVSFIGSLGGGARSFLPTFLTKRYGESVVKAGMLSGLTQVIGSLSLVLGGVLADRYDKASIAAASYALTGISIVAISVALFPSLMLLPMLAMLGFSQYLGGPAMHALTQSVSGEFTRGRATGLEFSFLALGGVGASLLTGFLIDLYNITSAFILSSIFVFTAGFLILTLRKKRL